LISQACGWSWREWLPLAGEAARVVGSAAAAAGLAAMALGDDIVSFLVAGGVYVSACLALMAVAVPPFQTALRRVASAVARRIRPRFIGGRVL
jgi:hypothetical protein